MRSKNIVCINDITTLGKCGLGITIPVLSHYGHSAISVPTGVFSAHTGIAGYRYQSLDKHFGATLSALDSAVLELDYLYSGFFVNTMQIDETIQLIHRHKTINIIIDPVMGDNGAMYDIYDKAFLAKMREYVGLAYLTTPNLTEAAYLCDDMDILHRCSKANGICVVDNSAVERLVYGIRRLGAKNVAIKSIVDASGNIGVAIAREGGGLEYHLDRHIEGYYSGCGDLFASIVVGEIASGRDMTAAIKKACSNVASAIRQTADSQKEYGIAFESVICCL